MWMLPSSYPDGATGLFQPRCRGRSATERAPRGVCTPSSHGSPPGLPSAARDQPFCALQEKGTPRGFCRTDFFSSFFFAGGVLNPPPLPVERPAGKQQRGARRAQQPPPPPPPPRAAPEPSSAASPRARRWGAAPHPALRSSAFASSELSLPWPGAISRGAARPHAHPWVLGCLRARREPSSDSGAGPFPSLPAGRIPAFPPARQPWGAPAGAASPRGCAQEKAPVPETRPRPRLPNRGGLL